MKFYYIFRDRFMAGPTSGGDNKQRLGETIAGSLFLTKLEQFPERSRYDRPPDAAFPLLSINCPRNDNDKRYEFHIYWWNRRWPRMADKLRFIAWSVRCKYLWPARILENKRTI